jgi:hypothetical protein
MDGKETKDNEPQDLKKRLNKLQYEVTQQNATEPPFREKDEGTVVVSSELKGSIVKAQLPLECNFLGKLRFVHAHAAKRTDVGLYRMNCERCLSVISMICC